MTVRILQGDCRVVLPTLAADSYHCCITSPPYWQLRDYGVAGQIGLEATVDDYVSALVDVFREVRRVLRPDGTCWVNLGDKYVNDAKWGGFTGGVQAKGLHGKTGVGRAKNRTGLPPNSLVGIPWRVALALQADGWCLRCDVVWHKSNPTPEPAYSRPARAHEYIFLLSKSERYFFDAAAVREPVTGTAHPRGKGVNRKATENAAGSRQNESWSDAVKDLVDERNCRSVWTFQTEQYGGDHFAVFPRQLAQRCILAGTSERGCCPGCGAPWQRLEESVRLVDGQPAPLRAARTTDRRAPASAQGVGHGRIKVARTTRGWAPTCACEAGEPVPCSVLDPFGGTGTTGEVATTLGRHADLVELKPDYVLLAEQRTAQGGLFASRRSA